MNEPLNALTETIIGAALEVHQELGPGLLENAYEACLAVELSARGLSIERQKALPVVYKNQRVKCPVGLLFNFHAGFLTRDGLKRVVNAFPE